MPNPPLMVTLPPRVVIELFPKVIEPRAASNVTSPPRVVIAAELLMVTLVVLAAKEAPSAAAP